MDNIEKENQELSHYGIPGMKWGVHRAQVRDEKLRKKVSKLSNIEIKQKANKIIEQKVKIRKQTGKALAGALNGALIASIGPAFVTGIAPLGIALTAGSLGAAAYKIAQNRRRSEMLKTLDDVIMLRQSKSTVDELTRRKK